MILTIKNHGSVKIIQKILQQGYNSTIFSEREREREGERERERERETEREAERERDIDNVIIA